VKDVSFLAGLAESAGPLNNAKLKKKVQAFLMDMIEREAAGRKK